MERSPLAETQAAALAALIGLDLPDACRAGVAQNLELLRSHLRRLDEALDSAGEHGGDAG
jgi:hypothetical protein